MLISRPELSGGRPYRKLWLAGFVFWLLAAHWIRLPHPANYIAWLALATYLGTYLPAFVALSRVGVHRFRLPVVLVAPVVWVGLDWLRGWLFTGFSMCSLCHSQANNNWVIQIADLGGEYLVSFVLLMVAACVADSSVILVQSGSRLRLGMNLAAGLLAVVLCNGYSMLYFMDEGDRVLLEGQEERSARIALIQGNTPADWKSDPQRQRAIMEQYIGLSLDAVTEDPNVDLVIWPETAFREPLISVDPNAALPPDALPPGRIEVATETLRMIAERLQTSLLVGVDRLVIYREFNDHIHTRPYNSSIMVDQSGSQLGTYDKMHLVPFGEYIPLAKQFPLLYTLTPVAGGAEPGESPTGMRLDDLLYVPNICYESAVPALIRQQVNTVSNEFDQRPDVLVNLTNDAWYWGSSELDLHLACSVFRAVEMRLPHVIAANGGLSAVVNRHGEIEQVTTRQQPEYLIAEVAAVPSGGATLYARWGDWLALPCVLCCVVLAATNFLPTGRSD